MDEKVVRGPKPARDDACVLTGDEDGAVGTYGLWCLNGGLRGLLDGEFIQGGEDVRGPPYVV